jgi:hemoglobin
MGGTMPEPAPIDEPVLRDLVNRFYARVRLDPMIGPLFDDAIHDWPAHLDQLVDFWSSVMLGKGRYKGRPVPAHYKHIDRLTPEMFGRWLALWGETTSELLAPAPAAALQAKAARIAESLQLALFFRMPA